MGRGFLPRLADTLGQVTFRLLYWSIAVATFRHSALGFSTLEAGNVLLGALSAIAVDIGVMLNAERLQRVQTGRGPIIMGLALSALASIYSQLLYTVTHADAVPVAAGALWMQSVAEMVINLRVVIVPVLLPALAVVYSFASDSKSVQEDTPVVASDVAPDVAPKEERQALTKLDQCRIIWEATPDASVAQVANLVGCAPSTASRARNGHNGKGA